MHCSNILVTFKEHKRFIDNNNSKNSNHREKEEEQQEIDQLLSDSSKS